MNSGELGMITFSSGNGINAQNSPQEAIGHDDQRNDRAGTASMTTIAKQATCES